MDARPGDWQCPNPDCANHTRMVFGSKANCPKCGAARDAEFAESALLAAKAEKGMHGGDMPGDWPCPNPNCKNNSKMVFAKHMSCPSCGTARNASKPGDWLCPNPSCINNKNTVFASKVACPKCGAPRPGSGPMSFGPQQAFGGCGGCGGCGGFGGCGGCGIVGGGGGGGGDGDWHCPNPNCINNRKMVFGKNRSCPKCGSQRPMGGGRGNMNNMGMNNLGALGHLLMQVASGSIGGMGGSWVGGCGGCGGRGMFQNMPGGGGRGKSNPGDWRCPNQECVNSRNNVFAKHDACPKCGTEKPIGSARGGPY